MNESPVSQYEYRIRLSSVKKWGAWKNVGRNVSVVVSKLKRNKSYSVQIRATNLAGQTLSAVAKFKQKR